MWVRTAFLSLAVSLAARAAQDAKPDPKKEGEDEAKAKIAEFKKELKTCRTDADRARALEHLGATQHPKIQAELKIFLANPVAEIAIAAAEQIGKYKKDREASDMLFASASSRREKEVIVKCLRYAGDVGYKPGVSKLTTYFKNKEIDVAKESIDSCAKLRSKDAIDPLLSLLHELEAVKEDKNANGGLGGGLGGGGLYGGGLGSSANDDQIKRKKDLVPQIQKALEDIAGEKHANAKEWGDWWRKTKATFKERDVE
jgi:hypothetical protein